jgi:PII-like signaling protein
MNAPLSHTALAPVKASDLVALPLIEKWIAFATVSRDSNLALLDWTEAYLKDLGIACSRTYDDSGQKANLWATLPAHDTQGRPLWQKLTVHTSESTRHDGVPIHRALVRRLWESQATSGATVLRGIWGFHGDHKPHGDKLIQFGRQVPVTTIIVDTPRGIARSFEIVDELTGTHGLVTCETVPALIALSADGRDGRTELADARY